MTTLTSGVERLLDGVTAPCVSKHIIIESPARAVQVVLSGGTAIVSLEVSLDDDVPFFELARFELSGATSDGFSAVAPWRYARFRVISLDGGTVTALVGA